VSESTRNRLLRVGDENVRVSNIELFFDLVYVFAVTQLAHHLSATHSVDGVIQTAVLLAMVWQVWVYTTWFSNYLDPDHQAVRLTIVVVMLLSLVLAAALPEGFTSRGWIVAVLYSAIQIGRSLFAVVGLRGERLHAVFVRFIPWLALGAVPMLLGATVHGHAREALWALSIAIEVGGAAVGFWTPVIGRSETTDWTISGAHFAERCQAFVLIALGESIVVTGTTLSHGLRDHLTGEEALTFVVAFAGAVALWWVYFDQAAEKSAERIEASDDPGRLGRSAFHWVHPLIVGGIIVSAAADERVLADPSARGHMSTSLLVLGGTALFLVGHAVFKGVVFRLVSWPRVVAAAVLMALLLLAPHVTELVLSIVTLAVVLCVPIADRLLHPAWDAQFTTATP